MRKGWKISEWNVGMLGCYELEGESGRVKTFMYSRSGCFVVEASFVLVEVSALSQTISFEVIVNEGSIFGLICSLSFCFEITSFFGV